MLEKRKNEIDSELSNALATNGLQNIGLFLIGIIIAGASCFFTDAKMLDFIVVIAIVAVFVLLSSLLYSMQAYNKKTTACWKEILKSKGKK